MSVPEITRQLIEDYPTLRELNGAPVVHVTAALFTDPHHADAEYMTAAIDTVLQTVACGVPLLVMVDHRSHRDVGEMLRAAGAIVAAPPRPGLTGPYVDGALAARHVAGPGVCVVRGEPPKAIGKDSTFFDRMVAALNETPFVIGERGSDTWNVMPRALRYAERRITGVTAKTLPQLPSPDVASGIFGMTGPGLDKYVNWMPAVNPNDWRWPIMVAIRCIIGGVGVGKCTTDFEYMVNEDRPERVLYRLMQLPVMIGAILDLGGYPEALLDAADQKAVDDDIAELHDMVRGLEQLGEPGDVLALLAAIDRQGGLWNALALLDSAERRPAQQS